MFAELVAVPPDASIDLPVGARFPLGDEPLSIGRSARCTLTVAVASGHEVLLGLRQGTPTVWSERESPVTCSLSGRPFEHRFPQPLEEGDHLVFVNGLVIALRERPSIVARDEVLERAVSERSDDPECIAVYVDFLRERGDSLADWLVGRRHEVEARRFFAMGPLSESARSHAIQPTFSTQGLVTSLRIARHAIVGAPGLFWHLSLLAAVPVLRTVSRLDIDYVLGVPAKHLVAPAGFVGWPKDPPFELVTRQLFEALGRSGLRSVRQLRLGFAASPPPVDEALVRTACPHWDGKPLVSVRGW